MQTWPMTVGLTAQTDLQGKQIEGTMDLCSIQPISPNGDEQVGRHQPPFPMSLSSGDVVCEHFSGRRM